MSTAGQESGTAAGEAALGAQAGFALGAEFGDQDRAPERIRCEWDDMASRSLPDLPDLAALPFDSERMLEGLLRWVAVDSPTHEAAGVNAMMDLASHELYALGAGITRLPGRMGYGDCLVGRLPHPTPERPGILVLGHMDTVHPRGTLHIRRDGERAWGPGIFDMKGGIYLAFEAIRQLADAGIPTRLPVTVLLTSDEEVGSPSTRTLIEATARRHVHVLVPEPARRDGGVVVGRYAIARFRVTTRGKPSHAGLRLGEGRSAIREMAHQIIAIEGMTDEEAGFNAGIVRGGEWSNVVAMRCEAEVLASATTEAKLAEVRARMQALKPLAEGEVEVAEGPIRPVWNTSPADRAMHALAARLAESLGFEVRPQLSGGGSDGNFTGALGIPTLDGLGPCGEGPHTPDEHIVIESLAERGRLMAGLLAGLG
jgi:glutamate carboxypeptidase